MLPSCSQVKVSDISKYNEGVLKEIDPAILSSIKTEKDLNKADLEKKLETFFEKYTASFVAQIAA